MSSASCSTSYSAALLLSSTPMERLTKMIPHFQTSASCLHIKIRAWFWLDVVFSLNYSSMSALRHSHFFSPHLNSTSLQFVTPDSRDYKYIATCQAYVSRRCVKSLLRRYTLKCTACIQWIPTRVLKWHAYLMNNMRARKELSCDVCHSEQSKPVYQPSSSQPTELDPSDEVLLCLHLSSSNETN